MILVEDHSFRFKQISQQDILGVFEYSSASFSQLCNYIQDRKKRESAIPYQDYEEVLRQILELPYLGGVKGSLMLLSEQKAMIGSTLYKEIKQELKYLAEEALHSRKQQSELEKNQYSRKNSKEKTFEKMQADHVDDIWAIDYVELWLLGIKFYLCVVYEVYSQSYLSIIPAFEATKEVAVKAMKHAFNCRNTKPKKCIIFDGGSQFGSDDFAGLLDKYSLIDNKTPPGEPWHNGALESGNRDLKKALYTHIFYQACLDPGITKRGIEREKVFNFLNYCCEQVTEIINNRIVRPKFRVTPKAVIDNDILNNVIAMNTYRETKIQERKAALQKEKGSKEQKIRKAWNKLKRDLSIEKLFAFTEVINERFQAIQV